MAAERPRGLHPSDDEIDRIAARGHWRVTPPGPGGNIWRATSADNQFSICYVSHMPLPWALHLHGQPGLERAVWALHLFHILTVYDLITVSVACPYLGSPSPN